MASAGTFALRVPAPQSGATQLAPSTRRCTGAWPCVRQLSQGGASLRQLSQGGAFLRQLSKGATAQSLRRRPGLPEKAAPRYRCAPVRSSLAEGNVEQESSAARAIQSLQKSFQNLSADALSSLPGDLKAELKDAGFALSSGPVLLELGDEVGGIVLDLGGALEAAGASVAAQAGERLCASLAGGVPPPGSSARAALGRRLKASGRFLTGLGTGAPPEITGLGRAMAQAGVELSRGSEEKAVDAAAVYGKRSFKVANLEIEVTASRAATGAVVAGLFSAVAWKIASVVDSASTKEYATDGAALAALSLKQTLLIVGYGSATLSLISCIALGVLALQLSTDDKST